MTSTTIRVAANTRDAVNRIRELTGDSTASVIEKALEAYEESLFWERWRQAQAAGDIDDGLQMWDRASRVDLDSGSPPDRSA